MRARLARPIDGFDNKTKKAVIAAATDEFERQKKDFLDMVFNIILWTLHTECGFGLIRMKRFYRAMFRACYITRERYELVGSERMKRPMSDKVRKMEQSKAWSYPEWVKDQLHAYGWDTEKVEEEFYNEYIENGEEF